ncbi:MAG: selenide, water dikinase SelD, partial [Planctomycetota bacterium]|nr:selenide, water dikinase SelD [Planctomycetota bacterium]
LGNMATQRPHPVVELANHDTMRDLVLIGAGHTHLHVMRMWRMRAIDNVRLTVVSPFGRATYSGMLPGTLAGLYRPEEMEIDLWRFVPACGGRLIVAEAVGLDPKNRQLELADRPPIRFDVASVGIGSVPSTKNVVGPVQLGEGNVDFNPSYPRVIRIKPMATFRERLATAVRNVVSFRSIGSTNATQYIDSHTSPLRLTVVGGGAGGIEIALAAEVWLRSQKVVKSIRSVRREFENRGIELRLNSRVTAISLRTPEPPQLGMEPVVLTLDGGESIEADVVIWATAAAAPAVLERFQLPRGPSGFLAVRPTLQSTGGAPVFAVGDTADFQDHPVPKAGVYAVRQGPVLWENLNRFFAGRELVNSVQQRGFLSLLSLGDGRAIADYRGWSATGRWAWRWKDWIDRRFMKMYRDDSPLSAVDSSGPQSASMPTDSGRRMPNPMRCAGCGAKVSADVLNAVFERLRREGHGGVVGEARFLDDAYILPRQSPPVDVFSVDFFPSFLDDPYLFGRIAALNALSDIWAMGAIPNGGLAIITLPVMDGEQQSELLYQILAGGLTELTTAGATLWGGHTTEGPQLVAGYSVAGRLDNHTPFRKGNLFPGDQLILTKPIGTGVILAAQRGGTAPAHAMESALSFMLRGNGTAAAIAREFDLTAVTDVTGFGLAGHLLEMLEASGCSARLNLNAIPVLSGFEELAAAGFESSLAPGNRARCQGLLADDPAQTRSPRWPALFDPQTSGGLLLAAPMDRVSALIERLRDRGEIAATIVGHVTEREDTPVLRVGSVPT